MITTIWQQLVDWFSGLFPRVTQYNIEPAVLATMRELAWQTHPKEVIGLLQGRNEGAKLVVDAVVFQPFVNTRASATISMDSTLTGIVGSFHSHPGASAQPSRQDLRMFAGSAGIHGILAEPYSEVHIYDSHGRLLGVHSTGGSKSVRLHTR